MGIVEIILIGLGLSADACAVSMSNGLANKNMKFSKILLIALFFGLFQAIMPLIGYFAGSLFTSFISKITPYIALVLLSFLGIKMIYDSIKHKNNDEVKELSLKMLCIQAVATSIDALAVGLVFVGMESNVVYLAILLIGLITFLLSFLSVFVGMKFGTILSNKAEIIGGIILLAIGIKIFIEYLIKII